MATSQNGYVANREDLIRTFEIPRCERHIRLRQGAPGLLLIHFATWFDRKVERLDKGNVWDSWGYAERDIRGSTEISNHASGTAEDLNATLHPLGVPTRETFSRDQIAAIHHRLRLYNGCIRWGGDYQNRPDSMHFEIDCGIAKVRRVWHRLSKTPIGREVVRANHY